MTASAWNERAAHLAARGLYDPLTEHDACGVGMIAAIDGKPRREIVTLGIEALKCVWHRGAVDADGKTGDGAGLHVQIPQAFFEDHLRRIGKTLRGERPLAVGMLFLPRKNLAAQEACRAIVEREVLRLGCGIYGWRQVPVCSEVIGEVANDSRPEIEQILIYARPGIDEARFELELYAVRKRIENAVRALAVNGFYICSLSCRSLIYKGLFKAEQLTGFYPDLMDERFTSSYALFHQRFSTNTAPAWHLAQPFRMLAHNGEINTLRGNINFMRSHEATFKCEAFSGLEEDLIPVIPDNTSDTGALDAVVEILTRAGRPLPLAKLIVIPPAWSLTSDVPQAHKDLFSCCNTISEPWDGPAAIVACDGEWAVAGMDRNGLRPLRYSITGDGLLLVGSETGMIPVSDAKIIEKGRLGPGDILGVNLREGKLYKDRALKDLLAAQHPYGEWGKNIIWLKDILNTRAAESPLPLQGGGRGGGQSAGNQIAFTATPSLPSPLQGEGLLRVQLAVGLTHEEIETILHPMAETAKEPVGSMGDDTPLAVLSDKHRGFHHFFRQNFSQVTNPPIDPLRERRVMSLYTRFGNDGNYLALDNSHSAMLLVEAPILLGWELEAIRTHFDKRITVIGTLFDVQGEGNRLRQGIARIVAEAEKATLAGKPYLLLTDEHMDGEHAAIPMILAVSAVHSHLVKKKLRKKASLLVKTAECLDVHCAAVLIGCGATVVNPYLAEATIAERCRRGLFSAKSLLAERKPLSPLPLQGGGRGGGRFRDTDPRLIINARNLRKNSTEAEKKLWRHLSRQQMEGAYFRRQHPIGPYIADFACTKKKLVIELDGGQHAEQQVYDEERTRFLEQQGYRVLRFWNPDVMQNIEGVWEMIVQALHQLSPQPKVPPPTPPEATPTPALPLKGGGGACIFSPLQGEEVFLARYKEAMNQGLLKIMSKMGISVVSSYRGGLNFEALGLSRALVAEFFPGLPSRISGIGLQGIEQRVLALHALAFGQESEVRGQRSAKNLPDPRPLTPDLSSLPIGGFYRSRAGGERHAWEGELIHLLQSAAANGSYALYEQYSEKLRGLTPVQLRDLLDFRSPLAPVGIDQVESITEIRKRFVAPAMSLGALSPEAHETLAIAMNRIGAASNSGEGGESPDRYRPRADGDNANSTVKQVASARFGVTAEYLNSARELQIKIAQGAKPGEGGQLPGFKVTETIAALRHATPGVTLISPPPHHDIYSIEDLAQLIYDLKQINPSAIVSVKLVAQSGIGTIASGVAKAMADKIVIAGHSGGTGASPWSSIKHSGIPWEMGLAEANQVLTLNRLRHRVKLQTDGGIKTGRDIVIAAMLGAEEYALGTASLVAMGCLLVRQCHSNTCPVGITTQDPKLRAKFEGSADKVINLLSFVAEEARQIIASLGFTSFNDIIGRSDLLTQVNRGGEELVDLDLNNLLTQADPGSYARFFSLKGRNEVPDTLDARMLRDARGALERGEKIQLAYTVKNTMRAVGTRLSSEMVCPSPRRGEAGRGAITQDLASNAPSLTLPLRGREYADDHITLRLRGSAGQSLGAFAVRGLKIELYGDANDYVGKGLSGGSIVIRPRPSSKLIPHENTIIGNTVLYGATAGKLFASGQAGERFAVRNSGAMAVVEGCGSNGCEYMTGGVAVILGGVGHNFGAGMTGGMAFVYDEQGRFEEHVNTDTVVFQRVAGRHWEDMLKTLIEEHFSETGSPRAEAILSGWEYELPKFRQICPKEMVERLKWPLNDASPVSRSA